MRRGTPARITVISRMGIPSPFSNFLHFPGLPAFQNQQNVREQLWALILSLRNLRTSGNAAWLWTWWRLINQGKRSRTRGLRGTKASLSPPCLDYRKQASFSLLDPPWAPKGRFKQFLLEKGRAEISGLPRWRSGKESVYQCRRHKRHGFNPWVRKKWQPTLVFLTGKSHWQRNLVGYSPLGHKESDLTEPKSKCIYPSIHLPI